MTIEEAIFVLNCVEAHGICIEAKKMAIKSLEMWDKVKEEMQEQYRAFANIPSISDTWTDAIEIVDKHLSEVSE